MKRFKTFSIAIILVIVTMLCACFGLVGCTDDGNGDAATYYTVTFDSCGGSAVESQCILKGNPVKNPDATKRENYSFIGWYKSTDANAEEWKFATDTVNADITLYAKWVSKGQSSDITPSEPKVLVAYFSATNTTKGVAQAIHNRVGGSDIYEIVPAIPYTSADLNYNDRNSRSSKENNDSTARPAISGSVESIEQYDVIFIGYPIWWGQAPKIIYTFFESYDYDFDGVTIIPFCTSASSPMGSSATNLHGLASSANWKSGARISGNNVSGLIAQMN